MGHLPQGAPTSPSLSNLVCRELDKQLTAFSVKNELEYSRYSDDITFSSKNINFSRKDAIEIIKMVYKILINYGFTPNIQKQK
ncbi:reverse transcriptase domain-containing protein [Acinetobacter baumannii]